MKMYEDPGFFRLLTESYKRLLGRSLVPESISTASAARWLYEHAPFGVLAHTPDADPIFMYGNRAAQRRFEYSWEEIVCLPSRLSAEAPNREARQQFLDRVTREGYSSGYKGVRVTKSGRRFLIEDATLWQLLDERGTLHGQAVIIPKTTDL
jgi:PAS domain-containing protein